MCLIVCLIVVSYRNITIKHTNVSLHLLPISLTQCIYSELHSFFINYTITSHIIHQKILVISHRVYNRDFSGGFCISNQFLSCSIVIFIFPPTMFKNAIWRRTLKKAVKFQSRAVLLDFGCTDYIGYHDLLEWLVRCPCGLLINNQGGAVISTGTGRNFGVYFKGDLRSAFYPFSQRNI